MPSDPSKPGKGKDRTSPPLQAPVTQSTGAPKKITGQDQGTKKRPDTGSKK